MPAAEAIARVYADSTLVVVPIANENLSDSTGMRAFHAANYLVGLVVDDDKRHFPSRYQVWAVPWSVLLDREGKVAWQRPGVVNGADHPLSTQDGERLLRKVLAKG